MQTTRRLFLSTGSAFAFAGLVQGQGERLTDHSDDAVLRQIAKEQAEFFRTSRRITGEAYRTVASHIRLCSARLKQLGADVELESEIRRRVNTRGRGTVLAELEQTTTQFPEWVQQNARTVLGVEVPRPNGQSGPTLARDGDRLLAELEQPVV